MLGQSGIDPKDPSTWPGAVGTSEINPNLPQVTQFERSAMIGGGIVFTTLWTALAYTTRKRKVAPWIFGALAASSAIGTIMRLQNP